MTTFSYNRIALLIGINEYKDRHFSVLKAPAADVKALCAVLLNPKIGAFDDVRIIDNMSLENVLREIVTLFQKKTREDLILLYFSGHGVLDRWYDLYLALPNTEFDLIWATAIPTSFIKDQMTKSCTKKQVLILDCCHSGAFERGRKSAVGTIAVRESTFLDEGYGREVLTSSSQTQYAWEGDNLKGQSNNSLFTFHLVKGMETGEAGVPDVGVITVEELYQYVHKRVVEENPYMTPQRFVNRQEGSFAIARNVNYGKTITVPPFIETRARKQVAVLQIINAYRFRGHRMAAVDPLHMYTRPDVAELDPAFHGLSVEDMDTVFNRGSLYGPTEAKFKDILEHVRNTYCRTTGSEYMHINETAQKRWIQERLELCQATPSFSIEKRRQILERIIAANALEEYLHAKYVGQERFSLEGGESLIPLLNELVQSSGAAAVKEIVIGMAHRGRLNVLVNVLGKRPADLFKEYEGNPSGQGSSGDVIYNLGYSSDIGSPGGLVHVSLAFNPSHLEIIDSVVEGSVRVRQERRKDIGRSAVLPILIHGDAAFVGQGVVMETIGLSQTRGYTTGGTIHVIVNNQIGFTTSDPLDSRSTLYCTDIAKAFQLPIFHVNGDEPEAVVFIAQLALDYRMEFNHDIVIDLVCYRRHGHSEADEPSVTQPIMYQSIKEHAGIRKLYADKLVKEGVVSSAETQAIEDDYLAALERGETVVKEVLHEVTDEFRIDFDLFKGTDWRAPVTTGLERERVQHLGERFTSLPEGFTLHPSVSRIMGNRRAMARGEHLLDWGFAETLAYASLVEEGYPVRISGQDSARGTFFHRHAVLHDAAHGNTYLPLQHIAENQAQFLVINSVLSEEAVLGFEYGYSSSEPNALVIWEAQFGDFANNAQVVIDQFLTSGEAKWGRYCGLVLFLPHGYDGQGPDQSSAKLERYLQLCAEENTQVCIPSTPAQMFHLLRRQILRPCRKPLIIMTPKSLLGHPLSSSRIEELTDHGFQMVIDEIDPIDSNAAERLIFCTGKIYFDLLEARRNQQLKLIALARIEQLYPFPTDEITTILNRYPNIKEITWAQEEPKNQGAWDYMRSERGLADLISPHNLGYSGRKYSASPATGYKTSHAAEQQAIIEHALGLSLR